MSPIFAHAEFSKCDPKKEKDCRGSTDVCLSEKISIKDGAPTFTTSKPPTYDWCVQKQCTYAKEKAQQCWCGRETFDTALGKLGKIDISRCDPNLSKLISTVVGGTATDVPNLFSEQDVIKLVAQSIPSSDTATLSAVLRGVGIEGATEDVVKSDPQAAYDLLQGIANGDQSSAQKAADRLGLNADLSDAKTLQDKLGQALQDNVSPEKLFSTQYTFSEVPDTGVSDIERAKCAIAKLESGSCGGNYSVIGPQTRGGNRAFGKYQVMDFNVPSWTARSCGRALTPHSFLADPDCQEKVFENVFGSYVSSCGSYEGAASKWFSGSCAVRSGGDGWLSISGYVRKFSSAFAGATPSGISSVYAPTGSMGSPFANVSPVSLGSSASIGYTTGGYAPSYSSQPVSYQASPSSVPPAGSGLFAPPTTTATPVPVQPIAIIIAQPKSVVRGNPITVSWSSVGMSANSPCEVRTGPTVVGQGNGGSKLVPTGPATPLGSMIFALTCTSQSGQEVQQSASVIVN